MWVRSLHFDIFIHKTGKIISTFLIRFVMVMSGLIHTIKLGRCPAHNALDVHIIVVVIVSGAFSVLC